MAKIYLGYMGFLGAGYQAYKSRSSSAPASSLSFIGLHLVLSNKATVYISSEVVFQVMPPPVLVQSDFKFSQTRASTVFVGDFHSFTILMVKMFCYRFGRYVLWLIGKLNFLVV